jgi:hypothetical protein
MKLKLKALAAAAALATLAGGAQADITNPGSGNGSFVLVAFDTVTRDWYMRDLGFLFSTFLPNQVTLLSGEGGVTGTRTPEAGLNLAPGNTPGFSDSSFAQWLSTHVAANVRWFVSAVDDVGNATASNLRRLITSSANATQTATNGQIDNYVSSGLAGGLGTFFNPGGLSRTGVGDAASAWDSNFGLGANGLAVLDQTVNLFYFGRTQGTGGTTTLANGGAYRNSQNIATITFESDGDLIYALAPADVNPIPLPAAAWMLGAGLLGIGGFVRRRRQGDAA